MKRNKDKEAPEIDFEEDIELDESALDVEWLDHPRKVYRFNKALVHAERELAMAKERVDIIRAELSQSIRKNPKKYGFDKVTENTVTEIILLDEGYQAVNEAFIDARYEYDMTKVAVKALDRNKDALENLVRLHGMNYFAGPSIPHDLSKDWEVRKKQEKANTAVKMRKK